MNSCTAVKELKFINCRQFLSWQGICINNRVEDNCKRFP
jgi:hypothetical protein